MGLFSRKTPEEKRIKKFNKTERNLQKNINKQVTVGKFVAARAGAGGHKKQTEFIKQIKFIKSICLCELGKNQEAQILLSEFSEDYGLTFGKGDKYTDEYFKQNFKYTGSIFVSDLLKLVE